MDTIWLTFGHDRVKNILGKQLASGRLPHAYLLAGPSGLGKKQLALEFAKKVLNTEKLENHPDFQMLDLEGEITMEPVLGFIASLGFKPFAGEKKVAVINNAQNLNQQAANALLKTLEEPSASTVIILIAGSLGLLPTIVSRCQILNFSPFSAKQLEIFARDNSLDAGKEILELSFGRPGRLKKLAEDSEFFGQQNKTIELYRNIVKQSLGGKLAQLNDLAQQETADLENVFLTWLNWQAGQLDRQPNGFSKVSALSHALLSLRRNFNKKLILQSLFLAI